MSIQRYIQAASTAPKQGLSARFSDIALVVGVVAIVALMILPLPTLLIDLLVAINISFGVMLLLTTLYIRGPLDFSSFPSILRVRGAKSAQSSVRVSRGRPAARSSRAGEVPAST